MGNSQNSSKKSGSDGNGSTPPQALVSTQGNNNNNAEESVPPEINAILANFSPTRSTKKCNLRLVDAIEECNLPAVLAALQTSGMS